MTEYIERGAFIEAVKDIPMWGSVAAMFADGLPAADVAPVVHGRWIDAPWLYYGAKQYVCSRCRNDKYWRKRDLHFKEPYCPNCGALMDGGDSNAVD